VLAEIAELLQIVLRHGHELTIEPNIDNYALDIGIGASALDEEEALGAEEILTLESAPYSAAAAHASRCAACRCSAALPLEPATTRAAISLNHGDRLRSRESVQRVREAGGLGTAGHGFEPR